MQFEIVAKILQIYDFTRDESEEEFVHKRQCNSHYRTTKLVAVVDICRRPAYE